MGKKDVQYDHSWRIAPERGRNWASSDYVKYTHTYKEYPTLSIPVKTAGGKSTRRHRSNTRCRIKQKKRKTMKNQSRRRKNTRK